MRAAELLMTDVAEKPKGGVAVGAPLFAGRYEILGILGEGSFGVVYLAKDPRLGRDVALKFLRSEAFTDPQAQARFLREARSLAAVSHPNIVTVYDLGEVDGRPYLSLERIEGMTLREALRQGSFSVKETVAMGRALLSALAAIHGADLVHRDVKPGNVMLARDGRAKLMDFGLARGTASTFDLTGGGITAGTPYYMAPEQWRGKSATPRSDLFAVGTILYECLAGRVPFKAGSVDELQQAVLLDEPPPLREVRPEVPEALALAVSRALAKEPEDRFESAAEMREALGSTGNGPDETSILRGKASRYLAVEPRPLPSTLPFPATVRAESGPPAPRASRRRFLGLAAAAAALLAVGGTLAFSGLLAGGSAGIEVQAFRRGPGAASMEEVKGGGTVHSGDRLFFRVKTSALAYLYVVNQDSTGKLLAVFPSKTVAHDRGNPFEGGRTHEFPPRQEAAWEGLHVDEHAGEEVFSFIVSRVEMPWLEGWLGKMSQLETVAPGGEPIEVARAATRSVEEVIGTLRGVQGIAKGRTTPTGDGPRSAEIPDAKTLAEMGATLVEFRLRHEP